MWLGPQAKLGYSAAQPVSACSTFSADSKQALCVVPAAGRGAILVSVGTRAITGW